MPERLVDHIEKIGDYRGYRYIIKHIVEKIGEFYCGYVAVPSEHPLYGKDYDNTSDAELINIFYVHGGLTYSKEDNKETQYPAMSDTTVWWFGFDCNHEGDTIEKCNLEYVDQECKNLIEQFIFYAGTTVKITNNPDEFKIECKFEDQT